jgi:hypothetical protein
MACEKVLKVCKAYFGLRSQLLEVLRQILERENVLKLMKERVMQIQNELDIADSEDESSQDIRKELNLIGGDLVKATKKTLDKIG